MHPAEDLLIVLAESPDDARAATLNEHVVRCAECRGEVERFRSLMSDLRSDVVWSDISEPAEMPETLAALVERVTFERRHGTRLSESVAAAEQLNEEVISLLERDPRAALALSTKAIEAASTLPSSYPTAVRAQVLGTGWKNRGNVLRMIGEYKDAFAALDEAERAYSQSSVHAFGVATVDYVRATTHYFMGHFDAALSLVRRAALVFEQFADHRRHSHARLLEGCVLFDSGDARAAREVFYSLLPAAHADGDRATLARLFGNIAQCYVNTADHTLARTYARQALSLYRQLGMRTEAVRTGWIVGRLDAAAGESETALDRLRAAEREFMELAMPVEASLVALDIASLLIERNEVDEVPDLCRAIVDRFVAAELSEKTREAHALALESVRRGADPVELVAVTRRLVDALPASAPNSLVN